MQIYEASEDSLLLASCVKQVAAKILKKSPDSTVLDLGTGSCIQAEAALKSGFKKCNILAADINKQAVITAGKKGFKSIYSDLFSNIKGKFDFIIFNPPYLPYNKHDNNKDTCGGKKGYETTLRFIRQLKKHLKEKGISLLLISSLTNPEIIEKEIKKQNLKFNKLASQKLFFEKIFVYAITKISE